MAIPTKFRDRPRATSIAVDDVFPLSRMIGGLGTTFSIAWSDMSAQVTAEVAAARQAMVDGFAAQEAAQNQTLSWVQSEISSLATATGGKEPAIAAGTTAQYWRGDKTWQTLNKAAVGLSNVDNTADTAKPVSTATQTALDGKMASVMPLAVSTPSRTIGGSAFQPHATKPVFISYTFKTQVTNPLIAGSSTATVRLLSDATSTPTTERGRVEAVSSVALAVAIAITTSNTATVSYIVPPGHYVKIDGATVGTGANAIVSQVEEVLG